MRNFLDTGPFGKLLTAVDHKIIPPEILSETLVSPVTALEAAQHTPKLRIMREHRDRLRPVQSRFVRNPADFYDFLDSLATGGPNHYRSVLDALHAQCVMYPPFLEFHLSRYRGNPPRSIVGSQRFTSDVRDSMQLVISQEATFITSDKDLQTKASPVLNCHVIYVDLDVNCIIAAMRFLNLGWVTGDKVGCFDR